MNGVLFSLTLVLAHVLPDGEIERAVQITVRDDQLEVRYMIGMNDNTLAGFLKRPPSAGDLTQWGDYARRLQTSIPKTLQIELNGKTLELKAQRWRPLPLHQLQIECVFVADLTAALQQGSQQLVVHDRTFAESPGYPRLALKPVRLQDWSSATPPLLARTVRKNQADMTGEEQEAATQASATWTRTP